MIPLDRPIGFFDNSALNHLFGQSPHIDERMRQTAIERMMAGAPTSYSIALTIELLGEMAGLYFSNRPRFQRVARFVFETSDWRVLRPAFDDQRRPLRIAMEVQLRGRVPRKDVFHPREEAEPIREAFVQERSDILDSLAADATSRKASFAEGERARHDHLAKVLGEKGQTWGAEFAGWESDPLAVVDGWTRYEMQRNPRFYGLPDELDEWPRPRDFVTLWYARAYQAARLHEVLGTGRKRDDGGDLYDGAYFQDAAYSDVLVTGDAKLESRVRPLRLATPRVLSTEAWVAELLGQQGTSGAT